MLCLNLKLPQIANTEAKLYFHTPNGKVNTPRFMPVGTLATVKGIQLPIAKTQSEMILSNTQPILNLARTLS